jgi:hypothetical protein
MSEMSMSDREHVAELMEQIGDRYLHLVRENYLDELVGESLLRDELAETLRSLLHAGRFNCIYELACSPDWREAIVGLHYAIILASPAFDLSRSGRTSPKAYRLLSLRVADKYETDLRNRRSFPNAIPMRAAILLLALHRRRDVIVDYLTNPPFLKDSLDIDAAALVCCEKMTHEREEATSIRERVMSRIRSESWFNDADFEASKDRFLRSWMYWTKTGIESSGGPESPNPVGSNAESSV